MKRRKGGAVSLVLLRMLALLLLIGMTAVSACAEQSPTPTDPLKPADLEYEDGNIILHKQGERIGPDEWKVTVKATVGEQPVEKRKMEVVFVLDASGSMAWCTDEEAHAAGSHTHTWSCQLVSSCGLEEHEHTQEACYERVCGFAQEHTHTDDCYEFDCPIEEHEHTFLRANSGSDCYNGTCTSWNNSSHWTRIGWGPYEHNDDYPCHYDNGNYYMLSCTQEEHAHDINTCAHELICGEQAHTHSGSCYGDLTCTLQEHTHTADCQTYSCGKVECTHSDDGATACTYEDVNGNKVAYKSRLQAAKETIASMVSNLTKESNDNVIFKYVIFSSASSSYDNGVNKGRNDSTKVVSSFDPVTAEGGTYMYTGIQTGINQFSDNDYKKVLVVLTDGAANDSASVSANALREFKDPDGTDGTVFTVGFAYSNSTLASIAGNGGSYVHAGSDVELNQAMQGIETSLTAMLEDPMGTTVGFDKTSIQEIQTSGGVISSNNDTIYWHPAEDGSSSVSNSTIAYSYTVKLNDKADLDVGWHGKGNQDVPLNNPTYFLYGIKSGSNSVTDMKEALFPIPHAEYALSSIQTKWQYNGQDIQTPTEIEKIICDYASATYIPAFEQDYQTITPVIPVPGSNDYYRYVGTTVTADGKELSGVNDVDATKPVAYVVIHQYELVESNELPVGGTKVMVGRDFDENDAFTFLIKAVSPANAPMPKDDDGNTVSMITIEPDSGTSMAFKFGTISYNVEGTFKYTIEEVVPEKPLPNVVYDPIVHQLEVTVVPKQTGYRTEYVVSYTLDGVENGHLVFTNRLETGSLKVEKSNVTSHLPEHQQKEFGFLIRAQDVSRRPLNGDYQMTLSDGTTQMLTFTNGYAAVKLKAQEHVVISGLPDGATYTVTEDAAKGFTATASGDTGTIAADQQSHASFENMYNSTGLYQFIGTKTLEGATLQQGEFSFSVLDEAGNVVARGRNNADGNVFLDTLNFTQADIGTKTYTVMEDVGISASYIYDQTVYRVTLTIIDNGDGTLSVTDNLEDTAIRFANKYISSQLLVSKRVTGNLGSKNREFPFTLTMPAMAGQTVNISTDSGATYQSVTLNAQGQTSFTLRDGQSFSIYPVTGRYTVTETDAGGYTAAYSIDQGTAVNGTTASGTVDTDGSHVAFVNTLEASVPTGIHTSSASAIMGICLAMGLMVIMAAGRRLARYE